MQVVFADTNGSMSNFKEIKTYTDGQFTDVSSEDWFTENVKKAYELGLISGTSETTFTPDSNLNVAEVITLTSRIHDIYYGNNHNFESTTPWYQSYLDYAYKNFLTIESVNNSNEDPFVPFYGKNFTQDVTRGHFAMFLAWALPEKEFEAINNIPYGSIPDVEEDECYDEIYLLYNAGILAGSDEYGTFNQYSPIKRSEVAAIITRVVDKSLRKEFKLTSTLDKLQGVWSYKPLSTAQGELVIAGNEYTDTFINGDTVRLRKGTITLEDNNTTIRFKGTEYTNLVYTGIEKTEKKMQIVDVSDSIMTLRSSSDTTTYNKINTPDVTEQAIERLGDLLKLDESDFYEYPYKFRTLTSVTNAQCTSSSPILSTDSKEGYVPGYEVYTYEFPMVAKTNLEAYENYFKPYIEYLNTVNGLTKTKVTGNELLAPFKDVSYYYELDGLKNVVSVSWNLHEYTERVTIMIMFFKN